MFKSEKGPIFGRTGLQLWGIKTCRTGFCSSREEELITDREGREKETSFARWEFQSPKPNSTLEKKDPFSRLISGILRMLPGKSDMFFLQIWWLQKTPGNIFRQTWHLSTAHLPPSVRDHISGLHLYSLKATGYSPLSFYGTTGQDNILRNNKLTKHRVPKIDSVWHGIKSTWSKQRKQTLKGDVELHRPFLIQREQGVQGVQKQMSGLEIFPSQMYKVKKIVTAGFNCLEKNDGVSMQASWESGNNEHTNPNDSFMKRNLAELVEDSAKPTKGWWLDKAISKTRNVGWSLCPAMWRACSSLRMS